MQAIPHLSLLQKSMLKLFNSSIRNRVMEVVEKKIADSQKAYDTEVAELESKLESDKAAALDSHVTAIISKIL